VKLSLSLALFALSGVAMPRIFLVPEDYPTLQNGLSSATPGDTLSVRPSTRNHPRISYGYIDFKGKRIMVVARNDEDQFSGQTAYVEEAELLPLYLRTADCGDCNDDGRITIADATYLVVYVYRGGPAPVGEGDVNLDGGTTVADAVYLVNFIYRNGIPPCYQGWVGQDQVNEPDTLFDAGAKMDMERNGHPWAVWVGKEAAEDKDEEIFYTKWNGSSWQPDGLVNVPDTFGDYRPTIAIDDSGAIFAVWDHRTVTDDIWYSRWNDAGWDPPSPVHVSNDRDDYAPVISAGGDEVWVVWYEGAAVGERYYNVFASSWNGSAWAPPTQVSPPDSNHNWWAYVATDSTGRPHVVYCAYFTGGIYYSTYIDSVWTSPVLVSDTTLMEGYDPAVAIDGNGGIHIVWVGLSLDPIVDYDIYYSSSPDGVEWSQAVMINDDDDIDDKSPSIALADLHDIWVVWNKEYSIWDNEVFVSHYDGSVWASEFRLNNDTTLTHHGPSVRLDDSQNPWVIWTGMPAPYPYGHMEIYFNRIQGE